MRAIFRLGPQPRADAVEDEPAEQVVSAPARKLSSKPRLNCTHGSGAEMVVKPARRAVAPTVPRRSYICPAKSGNAAANDVRTAAFAAIADAAIGRYAVTRYVNTPV